MSAVFMRRGRPVGMGHADGPPKRHPCAPTAGSSVVVGCVVHVGVGNTPYCGGGKASTQEKLRPTSLFVAIRRRSGAKTSPKLRQRIGLPVHLGGIQHGAD